MSYTLKKDCIREDVDLQINIYKRGTKKQQHIVPKLEEFVKTVNCFQCLDTKQSWYFREQSHRLDNNGDYYVMTCAVCPNEQVKDKWIKDSKTCDLYGVSGIKLFNKENFSGAERFEELEKYVCKIYPEIMEEAPVYKKTETNHISILKKTYYLHFELGNVIDKCQEIFRGYCGDMTAIASLINNISVNINNCGNAECQKQILCEEIEPTKFIYVKIENNSTSVKKSLIGLCEYNKYHLDISIHVFLLRPENESAYQQCKNIVNKLGVYEIGEVSKIFLSIV